MPQAAKEARWLERCAAVLFGPGSEVYHSAQRKPDFVIRRLKGMASNNMNEIFDLTGKVAVITGASKGIGKAIAIALAEAGADAVLLQRSMKDSGTKQAIEKLGRRCAIVECDLLNVERAKVIIDEAAKVFNKIDILVNNAGMQRDYDAVDFPESAWDDIMTVHLKSVFILCQQAGKLMIAQGSGKIINISSIMAYMGGARIPCICFGKGRDCRVDKVPCS